jgi:putative transposase
MKSVKAKNTALKLCNHSVSSLKAHLVLITKNRTKVFSVESLLLIENTFRRVGEKMGFEIHDFIGGVEYVRVLIEYPPELAISQMVNSLKSVSSRRYSQAGYEKPNSQNALWSPRYYVTSAEGVSPHDMIQHVIKQEKPS